MSTGQAGQAVALCEPLQAERGVRAIGSGELGLLPCTLGHTGSARTKEFFRVRPLTTAATGGGTERPKEASLRGRLVVGTRVALPEGYELVMYAESGEGDAPAAGAQQGTRFEAFAKAQDVVVWNQEVVPTETDPIVIALRDWAVVAQAVCSHCRHKQTKKTQSHKKARKQMNEKGERTTDPASEKHSTA